MRLTPVAAAQFIILRQAFSPERMTSLLAAVRTMVAKGVAQEAAGRWVSRAWPKLRDWPSLFLKN